MSNELFQDHLRCPSFPYEWEFVPLSTISANPNKTVKQSFVHDPHDWMIYTVHLNQLQQADRDDMIDFLKAMGGNVEIFLFRDDFGEGYTVPRQTILTATGGETSAQVIRAHTVGATTRTYEVWNWKAGSGTYWLNGSPLVPLTENNLDDGTITFPALSPADVVEAQIDEYYRRVRFTGSLRNILRAYDLVDVSLGLAEEGVK